MKDEVRLAKRFLESRGYRVVKESKDYEDYTPEEFEKELDSIADRIEEIEAQMSYKPYDAREEQEAELEELRGKLISMEDYIPEDMVSRVEELQRKADAATDIEYEGRQKYDPYKDRGIKPTDFY